MLFNHTRSLLSSSVAPGYIECRIHFVHVGKRAVVILNEIKRKLEAV